MNPQGVEQLRKVTGDHSGQRKACPQVSHCAEELVATEEKARRPQKTDFKRSLPAPPTHPVTTLPGATAHPFQLGRERRRATWPHPPSQAPASL